MKNDSTELRRQARRRGWKFSRLAYPDRGLQFPYWVDSTLWFVCDDTPEALRKALARQRWDSP